MRAVAMALLTVVLAGCGGQSIPTASPQAPDTIESPSPEASATEAVSPAPPSAPAVTGAAPISPAVTDRAVDASSQRLTARPVGEAAAAPLGYFEYLPPGYGDGEPRPLLAVMHGQGESGDGSRAALNRLFLDGGGIPALIRNDSWPGERPFVVLAPQHDFPADDDAYASCGGGRHFGTCILAMQHDLGHPAEGSICMTPSELHAFLAYAIEAYDVDPERVYLTGLSCGAYAIYEYVAVHGATQVAAMVPIAGDARPAWEAAGCRLSDVAIWAFHGSADYELDPQGTIEPMTHLMECPQPPRQEIELTVYAGVDHNSWSRTYDLSAGRDIYEWLLRFSRP